METPSEEQVAAMNRAVDELAAELVSELESKAERLTTSETRTPAKRLRAMKRLLFDFNQRLRRELPGRLWPHFPANLQAAMKDPQSAAEIIKPFCDDVMSHLHQVATEAVK